MAVHQARFKPNQLWLGLAAIVSSQTFAGVRVSYGVPEGFSAAEMDSSANFVGTFNGKTLPGFLRYSSTEAIFEFDADKYAANGISPDEVKVIRKVISRIDYKRCSNGCDIEIEGYYVAVDKQKRSISIRDSRNDYLEPATTLGIVNNQAMDIRASSSGYRSGYVNGATWIGLPSRSFGYASWYANRTDSHGVSNSMADVSTYYLQKNFSGFYVRAGRQNSIDYMSGAVSTLLSPSFNQFVTVGSQSNLQAERNAGSLILYADAEGSYEFYRSGRLITRRPAVLGRNEISFADLPGGYYPVEVRLVDRSGNVIRTETRDINNVSFGAAGGNAWHITAGKDMSGDGTLLEGSLSHNFSQFYLNTSVLAGHNGGRAFETNVTRPMMLGTLSLMPTFGLLGGEQSVGGYADVSMASEMLGSLTVSHYLRNDVSRLYSGMPTTGVNYSRSIGQGVTFGYNYRRSSIGDTQQVEFRSNYRPNGLWVNYALGVQKGSFTRRGGGTGVYFNMTIMLEENQASFSVANSGGQTQVSGDYRRDFQDSFGTTTVGITGSHVGTNNAVNVYGSRSGTRGEAALSLGHDGSSRNIDFNYRGMMAANRDGIAFGRYSGSGSAMLLTTPDLPGTSYGFMVEGSPVGGNSTYAVPLSAYRDLPFAHVLSSSEQFDMNVEVPANIVRAHPGQVYSSVANVDINMIYSGFLKDADGRPVSGRIVETGDTVHRNGLFSIVSKELLPHITVEGNKHRYRCDLSASADNDFRCETPDIH